MFLAVPFTYEMSLGVRKGNIGLKTQLDQALGQECPAIQLLMTDYGVPLAASGEGNFKCESLQDLSSVSSH
jgi:hypothetical protein